MESEKSQKKEAKTKRYQLFDIYFAVIIALVLHAIILFAWIYYEGKEKPWTLAQQKPTRIRMVSAPRKSKIKTKAKAEPIPEKQLVSTPRPIQDERPEEADYVSEFDQKVREQTKSAKVGPDPQKTDKSQPSEDIKRIGPNVLVPEQRAGAPEQNLQEAKAEKMLPLLNPGQKGVLKRRSLAGQQDKQPGKALDKARGGQNLVNLMPSVQDLERYNNSAFNDHLENIEEDAETRLNTFQWKHATYFNRIKETVSHVWSPGRQIQRYDPQGTMLGQRDRYTVVTVSLDREGEVVDVSIKNESGVDYLDEEAVRTFKTAGPFPNPPQAVFGEGNTFTFAFGFYVSFEKGFFGDFGF